MGLGTSGGHAWLRAAGAGAGLAAVARLPQTHTPAPVPPPKKKPTRKLHTHLLGGGVDRGAEGPRACAVVGPDGGVVRAVAPQAAEPGRSLAGRHRHPARRALLCVAPVPHLRAERGEPPSGLGAPLQGALRAPHLPH